MSTCLAYSVQAQQVRVSIDQAEGSRRSDLGTLAGARVEYIGRPRNTHVVLRHGLTVMQRGGRSFGTTCQGLIPIGACPHEPIAERRRLMLGSFGVGVQSRPRLLGVSMHVDALTGIGTIVDRGVDSGERRQSSRGLLGVALGAEARVQPASSRVALHVGFDATGITPFVSECVDCWMPFGGNFGLYRWYGGIAIGGKRAR